MQYRVFLNLDGHEMQESVIETWSEAIEAAAKISGYTERTARKYLGGEAPHWAQPGPGLGVVMPKKHYAAEQAGVWVEPCDG